MKKLLTYIVVLVSLISTAQTINSEGNGFTSVSEAEGMSKSDIYQKAKEWVALNYNSAKNVIQLDTENKIIIKGAGKVNSVQCNHTFTISIKDGKFKSDYVYNSIQTDGYSLPNGGYVKSSLLNFEKNFLVNMTLDYDDFSQKVKDSLFLSYKNESVTEMMKSGISEKKALKSFDKYYDEFTIRDAYSVNNAYYYEYEKRASSSINNLREFILNGKSNDDW